MLPEVRAALDAAAQQYVHIDELMDACGARLAELTGAEWGLISSGCAAGLTHATAACVAGGNPDLHVRMPDLAGFAKDEVIIPTHSRNVYDAAVRAVGVKIVEVATAEELALAFGPKTAMVYILAGPNAERGPLAFAVVSKMAAERGVPVLVDAAAEVLTIPNVHLQRGATLVAYSGGKCIRGPQTAGILLGKKSLVQAAWVHSAPHHGFARSMKVGKEEAMAMLMAVEMWTKRDHKAEWTKWLGWMETVKKALAPVSGLTLTVEEPNQLSNRTPNLAIRWDAAKLGADGGEVARQLLAGEPRIAVAVAGGRGGNAQTGINIVAYMMTPGDAEAVGKRLVELFGSLQPAPKKESVAPSNVNGTWDVTIQYLSGTSKHTLHLFQNGDRLEGTHQGDFVSRALRGSVTGTAVEIASSYTERHGDSLQFRFNGTLADGKLSGDLDMGEYRMAKWTAVKRGA
jgi:seryl-tRNA(Sec) selenium transferase